MTRRKVLYIGGTGRTGSTVLDQLLGQFPAFFSGGEMAFFWSRGILANAICACGEPVRSCPVWEHSIAAVTDSPDITAEQMVALHKRFWSIHTFAMVIPGFARSRMRQIHDFPQTMQRLYGSILDDQQAQVFVDSSKEPHFSYILREGSDLDLRFLHLVRDPRAVGRSWQRIKPESGLPTDVNMERRTSSVAAAYYMFSDVMAEVFWQSPHRRYAFLRYEDFAEDPAAVLAAIGDFVDEPIDPGTVLDGRSFEAGPIHTSWGNPNRVGRTTLTIRADEAWRTELSRRDKIILTLLTLPLILRYGYPIRPSGKRLAPRSSRLRAADLSRVSPTQ